MVWLGSPLLWTGCRVAVGTQQLLLQERRGGKALRAWTTPAGGVGVPGVWGRMRGGRDAAAYIDDATTAAPCDR